MTSFIIIVVIALFMVLIGFTWYRLEAYEGLEKVIFCVAGIIVSWLFTSMLFSLSSKGMDYLNPEIKNEISKILIIVFTPINGIIIMPVMAKIISGLKFEEIDKQEAIKKILILICVLIVISIVEVIYLKNIQLGILNVATKM